MLRLTRTDGKLIVINPSWVARFIPLTTGTSLWFGNNDESLDVKESIEDILRQCTSYPCYD